MPESLLNEYKLFKNNYCIITLRNNEEYNKLDFCFFCDSFSV